MSDEELALMPVVVRGETVYVTRCGDLWRWKRTRGANIKFSKIIPTPHGTGYIYPIINGSRVLQHRIVSSAFLGLDISDTKSQIDHINGVRHDNRLANLRIVTAQENSWNRTKAKGYYWYKRNNKWRSYIYLNSKKIELGYYNTEAEARAAYLAAKKVHHIIHPYSRL